MRRFASTRALALSGHLFAVVIVVFLRTSDSQSHAAEGSPATQSVTADLRDLPENLRVVLANTAPLTHPRGGRLPFYILPISNGLKGLSDARSEQVLRLLEERGIAISVEWSYGNKADSLAEGLRVGGLQQKLGLGVNVNATSCLQGFFNGEERTAHIDVGGQPFFDDSFSPGAKMGCPFSVQYRFPIMKEQVEYFLRNYSERKIAVDFAFADWEIDGPIEWNGAWAASKRCRRCREHLPRIDDFRSFQKELRLIRSEMQRSAFGDNVTRYFPRALVGNYAVYPHDGYRYWYDYFETPPTDGMPVKADQKARYREWFPEFERTGYTFAMPVVYTWYPIFDWYDFADTDYRWFYNMLLVASNAGQHTPAKVPIISFVHWTTTAPPEQLDPRVKQFSAEKYQELLCHMLLRGHDAFFLWCQQKELPEEVRLVHEVYAKSLEHREFLERGEPVSFDVPREQGAIVSGVRLGNRVLARRTDFSSEHAAAVLKIDGKELPVPSAPGQWQILEIK